MPPTKLIIVEDNEALRETWALLFNEQSTNYQLVGTHPDCNSFLSHIENYTGEEVVLMDIDMPGINGIEGVRIAKQQRPNMTFIMITVMENSEAVFDALCAGALGYLTKSASGNEIMKAIEEVKVGGSPMSMNIARMVVASFQKNNDSPLTDRESEVLKLLSMGKSYTSIASNLFLSKETVKSHIKKIYQKLQVNSKEEAIKKANTDRLI